MPFFIHVPIFNMDSRARIDVIFLDFSVAFDTVSHSHLMTKLSALNLLPNVLSWIHAFATNPLQYCLVNNTASNNCPVRVMSSRLFFFLSSLTVLPIAPLPQFTSLPRTASSTVPSTLPRTLFASNMTLTLSLSLSLVLYPASFSQH